MNDRVVITGMGAISSLGLSVKECWQNAINGVSGVGAIQLIDASWLPVKIGCEIKGFQPENYLTAKEARRRDRFEQIAEAAAQEAIQQSGIDSDHIRPERVAVIVSSGIGGLRCFEDSVMVVYQEGPRKISPFAITMLMSNGAAGMIAIDHGFRGPCFCVSSACASGVDAIGVAWQLIRSGTVDVVLAGASEAPISPIGIAAFDRMGALTHNEDVSMVPRPFDLQRDGLVMGEGAAIVVMERESHARARRAEIYAELGGYAATADAFHITAPAEDGSGAANAMRLALTSAGVNPEDVSYVNAHGTGTLLNDVSETLAIKTALGEWAYRVPISSTKSMTGHMMSATGALEAVFCTMAVRENIVPPTIHYEIPDPKCDLDYVPNQARELPVRIALDNAFGFGGHNAVLVIRKFEN